MTKTTKTTKTAEAIAEIKKAAVAIGKVDQTAKAEGQGFTAELEKATDALATALTWKVGLETHVAVLKDGTVRKYIKVTKGLPRDIDVILVEGKGHSIQVKSYSIDKKYKDTEKKAISATEKEYNDAMDSWQEKCDKESKARLDKVLTEANTWDALWGYVSTIERNKEIAQSEKYFG